MQLMWSRGSRQHRTSRWVSKISIHWHSPSPPPPPCCCSSSSTPTPTFAPQAFPNLRCFQSNPNLGFLYRWNPDCSGPSGLFVSFLCSQHPGSRASRWCRWPGNPKGLEIWCLVVKSWLGIQYKSFGVCDKQMLLIWINWSCFGAENAPSPLLQMSLRLNFNWH